MAAKRAFTAARMHRSSNTSLQEAAESCGSNIAYVAAAVRLLKSEDQSLVSAVIRGFVPLLAAAKQARQLGELVAAYRSATASDRIAFAKVVGPDTIFDTVLVPAEGETVTF
jgi:hypothetical protein